MRSHERQFRLKETTLRNQHIQVIRQPTLVTKIGETECGAQGIHLLQLRCSLLANGSDCHQGVLDFLERYQYRLFILCQRLSGLSLGGPLLEPQNLCVK